MKICIVSSCSDALELRLEMLFERCIVAVMSQRMFRDENEFEVERVWYDDGSAVALVDVDAAGPISGDKRWLRLMRA